MQSTEIIYEVGINANGSLELAKKMIDVAHDAGCDYVKFQKRTLDLVYTKEELDAPRESPWGKTNRDQKKGLEFTKVQFDEIDAYCKQIGIKWFASCWDLESIDFIEQYDVPYHKIASALATNKSVLDRYVATQRPLILSTGMLDEHHVRDIVDYLLTKMPAAKLSVMHCTSTYPTKPEEMNISVIETLKRSYPTLNIGFSNHYSGIVWAPLAVAMGATMLEFHGTLDRTMYGSDQAASIEPEGTKKLVEQVRLSEKMLGDGHKRVYDSEVSIAKKLRKISDI